MTHNPKIMDLNQLAQLLVQLRKDGKRVVLSHGIFDPLHVGHIRHLEQAREMGDILVVTITPDEFYNKGEVRPTFSHDLRAEAVAALSIVDYVSINRWAMADETIRLLKPDVYVKGSGYKIMKKDIGVVNPEVEALREVGGDLRFTEGLTFSSSRLAEIFSPFSDEVNQYLTDFRQRHSIDEILDWVERASKLRPLVVGDAIIDEYEFCDGIGKSTKDPVLAVLQQSVERYAGGCMAIANHLAGICNEVELITQLGDINRQEAFVREALRPNVKPVILTKTGSPTVHKRRIVDRYSGNKLLEIYQMDDRATANSDALELESVLKEYLKKFDITVVGDYGHGMLTPQAIETICKGSPFLALNVQSNAGNRGFNPISKYRRADYVCVANHELSLEVRQRDGSPHERILMFAERIDCKRFTVTMGKFGTLHYDPMNGFYEAPALATLVRDRVGAGDAVLAITSLLSYVGAPWDIIAFVGNVAGAYLVAELGNRSPLEIVALSKNIVSFMR